MSKIYSDNYTFDPSSIIKVISENPNLGLALVQIPIDIAKSLIAKYSDLTWKDYPTIPGYYWLKSNGHLSIKEYSSNEINSIISLGNSTSYQYAGPIEPPK
jgi:hypothetical protein